MSLTIRARVAQQGWIVFNRPDDHAENAGEGGGVAEAQRRYVERAIAQDPERLPASRIATDGGLNRLEY